MTGKIAPPASGGGVDLEIVAETAIGDVDDLPNDDSKSPMAILLPLTRYLWRWIERREGSAISDVPVLFLFSEYPRNDSQTFGAIPHALFFADPTHEIQGRIYFSNSQLRLASSIEGGFRTIDEAVLFLKKKGLDTRTAVIAQPKLRTLLWCPNGVSDEMRSLEFEVPRPLADVSRQTVDKGLLHFHGHHAQVPDSELGLWHDAKTFVPAKDLEKLIQRYLRIVLQAFFREGIVVRELNLKAGRVDLAIWMKLQGVQAAACVLELKVLKSRHHSRVPAKASRCSNAANEAAIIKGLDQVSETRIELGSPLAFLCCYDAREKNDKSIMSCISGPASKKNVHCRRYYMYNSKEAYRRAQPGSAYKVSNRSHVRKK